VCGYVHTRCSLSSSCATPDAYQPQSMSSHLNDLGILMPTFGSSDDSFPQSRLDRPPQQRSIQPDNIDRGMLNKLDRRLQKSNEPPTRNLSTISLSHQIGHVHSVWGLGCHSPPGKASDFERSARTEGNTDFPMETFSIRTLNSDDPWREQR
jgi:hypothetical protein